MQLALYFQITHGVGDSGDNIGEEDGSDYNGGNGNE